MTNLLVLPKGLRLDLGALTASRVPRCQGVTKAGKPCRAPHYRVGLTGYCQWHEPAAVMRREIARLCQLPAPAMPPRDTPQARQLRGCGGRFKGPKTAALQRAVELCRADELTDEQIACELGVSRRTLARWKHREDFRVLGGRQLVPGWTPKNTPCHNPPTG